MSDAVAALEARVAEIERTVGIRPPGSAEPVAEVVAEPVVEPVAEPVADPVSEPVAEVLAEPVADLVPEIVVVEPAGAETVEG